MKLLGCQQGLTGILTARHKVLHFGYVLFVVCLLNHNQLVLKSKFRLTSMVLYTG